MPDRRDKNILDFPALTQALEKTDRSTASNPAYVELSAMTNYCFLEAASHAQELALTAAVLGKNAASPTATRWPALCVRMPVARRPGSA